MSASSEISSAGAALPVDNSRRAKQTFLADSRNYSRRTTVIGVYGISGCGKSHLLSHLRANLDENEFAFYEGSEVIASLIPGGLDNFHTLSREDQESLRGTAIDKIREDCSENGKVAVVTGHFILWREGEERKELCTQNDLDTYTHIVYLDVPAEIIKQRRSEDDKRTRGVTTLAHLQRWKQVEISALRILCREHSIQFMRLTSEYLNDLNKTASLLEYFRQQSEDRNLARAQNKLDEALLTQSEEPTIVLVLDGDRTLASQDTGSLFWEILAKGGLSSFEECPLKATFSSPFQYSEAAFQQAALHYEEATNNEAYETCCREVASKVTMYQEFVSLLRQAANQRHVCAVIITCGLRRVWELVLDREGLSNMVKVIGAGRIADGFVVTPSIKGALVDRLRGVHKAYVWAFGDSPLDIDMLRKADQAIVVVGNADARSQTMDDSLRQAIDKNGLQARQLLLPESAPPRLNTNQLPVVSLASQPFVDSILHHRKQSPPLQIILATNKPAAKLLATPMRDAENSGPSLRKAHQLVGWYLATEYITELIGLEECPITHVLGRKDTGYQLLDEKRTTIAALMRGGEPMALGVGEAFPLAMFVHARDAEDIKTHHLEGQKTILLVDSVVNSGKTIIEFVEAVRKINTTIRIVVVAGVVQAQCIQPDSPMNQKLKGYNGIHLVGLRTSETKFTGSGTTDTGNRLFNTTHLP